MRIWYVVDAVEYWLEPEYQLRRNGRFTVLGARLYTPTNKFKGYWHWANIPLVVKRQIRAALAEEIRRHKLAEDHEKTWLRRR